MLRNVSQLMMCFEVYSGQQTTMTKSVAEMIDLIGYSDQDICSNHIFTQPYDDGKEKRKRAGVYSHTELRKTAFKSFWQNVNKLQ